MHCLCDGPNETHDSNDREEHCLFPEIVARLVIVLAKEVSNRAGPDCRYFSAIKIIRRSRAAPSLAVGGGAETGIHRGHLRRAIVVIHARELTVTPSKGGAEWFSISDDLFLVVVYVHILFCSVRTPRGKWRNPAAGYRDYVMEQLMLGAVRSPEVSVDARVTGT